MGVFDHAEFDNHESLHFFTDAASGLQAIISIHSTVLGPAAGGVRRWTYASKADALTDVLRLSRGMTYKNAVADIPFGGGKAVILASDLASTRQADAFTDCCRVDARHVLQQVEDFAINVIERNALHSLFYFPTRNAMIMRYFSLA